MMIMMKMMILLHAGAADVDLGFWWVSWWMLAVVQCADVGTPESASSFRRCDSVSRCGSPVSWSGSVSWLSLLPWWRARLWPVVSWSWDQRESSSWGKLLLLCIIWKLLCNNLWIMTVFSKCGITDCPLILSLTFILNIHLGQADK